jgi:hypothetical protein
MGNVEQAAATVFFGIPKACTDGLIVRQAAIAGGLGACYAGYPLGGGERDGYPLGVKPAHIHAAV